MTALGGQGLRPAYGTGSLERLIQERFENPLAKHILGDRDAIEIDAKGETHTFTKTQAVLEAELVK